MARNKPTPKPIFAVKHDFYDSLDAFLQEVVLFHGTIKTALDLDQIKEPLATKIRERLAALDKAMMTED